MKYGKNKNLWYNTKEKNYIFTDIYQYIINNPDKLNKIRKTLKGEYKNERINEYIKRSGHGMEYSK